MLISDVLKGKSTDIIRVSVTDKIIDAIKRMADRRIGAVVVEDKFGKLIGIFSERDVLYSVARDGADVLRLEVQHRMTSPVITARSSERVEAALAVMTRSRIRHLPVVDDSQLIGIVSIGDLVKHRLDEKELEANVLLEISRMRA
jgi:CBS domain-containing protein